MRIFTQFAEKNVLESQGAAGVLDVSTGNAKRGTVKLSMSIADVHSYWHSFLPSVGERIPWTIETAFAVQRGMPFVTFFNT